MFNNKNKRTLVVFCALVLMLSPYSLLFKSSIFVASAQVDANPDLRRYEFVPDQIIYRTLFHSIFVLNQEADKAEREGLTDSALAFRRAFRQDADMSDEQAVILSGIATECEQAVRVVDAKARKIIDSRRSDNMRGALHSEPSPELATLQQERDRVILRYRDRLREAFGESEWRVFEQAVPARVASGIGMRRATPQSPFVKASLKSAPVNVTQGQSIVNGSTLISFNANSNIVTAVSTTELDFASQDWYMGRVWGNLSDANGNSLASAAKNDVDRDGTVSITMQATGQDQMTYSARGNYGAIADIQDPAQNLYYIDHWNFQEVFRGGEGGTHYYIYMPFYGFGPRRSTRLRNFVLGATSPATVQAKGDLKAKKPTFSDENIRVESALGIEDESTDVITQIETSTFGLQATDRIVVEVITTSGDGSKIAWRDGQVSAPTQISPGQLTTVSFRINSVSQTGEYTFRTRVVDVQRRNENGSYSSIFGNVTVNAGETSNSLTVRPD